jgi:CRISPR/Cas system-associated exonuclease Cas4 (RecB family)
MHTEICTLQQLIRNVAITFPGEKKLSSKQVKQALVVLWKHNCLTVECAHDVDLSEITMDANGLETKLKMTGLLYRLNMDNVVHRLRFGQILQSVQQKYGELGCWIAEEVIFHGRLRYGSICHEVLKKWKSEKARQTGKTVAKSPQKQSLGGRGHTNSNLFNDEDGEDFDEEEEMERMKGEIKTIFERLVQNRFFIIVPPLDIKKRVIANYESKSNARMTALFDAMSGKSSNLTSSSSAANKTTVKRGRAANDPANSGKNDPNEFLPVELRLMMEGQGLTKVSDGQEEEWDSPATKKSKVSSTASVPVAAPSGGRGGGAAGRGAGRSGSTGRGRGRGGRGSKIVDEFSEKAISEETFQSETTHNHHNVTTSSSSVGFGDSIIRGEVYWMIGYDQFIREERHKACVNIVSDQLENIAGEIVRIILQKSMNTELGANPSKSTALSLEEIYQQIKEYSHLQQQQQQKQKQQQQQQQQENLTSSSSSSSAAVNANILASIDLNTLKKLLDVMRLSSLGTIMRVSSL